MEEYREKNINEEKYTRNYMEKEVRIPHEPCSHKNVLIIGARATGKTSTIKGFIENFVNIHNNACKIIIFSQIKQRYENIMTNINYIYNEINDDVLKLCKSQKNEDPINYFLIYIFNFDEHIF